MSASVIGMIGTSGYVLADTLLVANGIGEMGLAALNLALPLFTIINGLGFLFGIGGATWYTILRAQDKHKKATDVFNHTLAFAGLLSLFIVLLGLFGTESITRLLGGDHETYAMTNTYIKTIMLFSPFFIFNNLLIAFIRNDGNPKLAMAGMLLGSFGNVVFDYIFIFPLNMGMFGAALATGFTPLLSIALIIRQFKQERNTLKIQKVKIKIKRFGKIISFGISAFLTEISTGVVMLVFNTLILGLTGNIGVAAYGVIANLAMIALSIFTGIAQGIQPIISHLFGLGRLKDLKKTLTYGIVTSLGLSTLSYLIIFFGSDTIVSLFNRDNSTVLANIAQTGLLIYFIGMFFAGINIIAIASLSAVEQGETSFRLSLLRSVILIVPIAYMFANIFGMNGVWFSFVTTEALVFILILLFQSFSKRKINYKRPIL